ncbi:hypothetical protein [Kocuria sabuli]|uniref:hypothetical protein n=1 Tax=Kocuria sabuli TaxID=3071448 RepID=UPI0034D469BA
MRMRPDETFHRLRDWTGSQATSEYLAVQVLRHDGYESIDPIHPHGGPDGGKDALARKGDVKFVMAVYFPLGQKSFTELKDKFTHDLAGVSKNDAKGIAFVTNQSITAGERKTLIALAKTGISVDIFHIERIVAILDDPSMHAVREQYLFIPMSIDPRDKLEAHRTHYLNSLWTQCHTRRHRRLKAAGIRETQLDGVVEFIQSIYQNKEIEKTKKGAVNLFVADAGSGKTEWTTHWTIERIEAALADPEAPLPIWIYARNAKGGLSAAIDACIGDLREFDEGFFLVLDGLDEVEPRLAADLLDDAESLCLRTRQTTVIATSRKDPFLQPYRPREIHPLSQDEGLRLAELVASSRFSGMLLSSELRQSLVRPLLAIAIGVLMSSEKSVPRTTSDLISQIPSMVMKSARITETATLLSVLTRISIHTIAHEEGIPISALQTSEYEAVLETPLIAREDDLLYFSLPIHEQYYGALAIKTGRVDIVSIASDDRFGRWRYAIALGISGAEVDQADTLFARLAAHNAGRASWVLREISPASAGVPADPSFTPQNVWSPSGIAGRLATRHSISSRRINDPKSEQTETVGKLLRDAYLTWLDGFGPLGDLLSVSKGENPPLPTWGLILSPYTVVVLEGFKNYGSDILAYGPLDTEARERFRAHDGFKTDDNHSWASLIESGLPGGMLARWAWSQARIKSKLESLVRAYGLISTPGGILHRERMWELAKKLGDYTAQRPDTPKGYSTSWVLDIIDQIGKEHEGQSVQFIGPKGGFSTTDLEFLKEDIVSLELSEISNPTPGPDIDSGDWIWMWYSRERTIEFARHLLENTISAYQDLVGQNFRKFGTSLDGVNFVPMRITAYLTFREGDPTRLGMATAPTLTFRRERGHFEMGSDRVTVEALGPEENAWDRLANHGDSDTDADNAEVLASYNHQMTGLPLGDQSPVTHWAYEWLLRDLEDIGWSDFSWRRIS